MVALTAHWLRQVLRETNGFKPTANRAMATVVDVYFCDPRLPWQPGQTKTPTDCFANILSPCAADVSAYRGQESALRLASYGKAIQSDGRYGSAERTGRCPRLTAAMMRSGSAVHVKGLAASRLLIQKDHGGGSRRRGWSASIWKKTQDL